MTDVPTRPAQKASPISFRYEYFEFRCEAVLEDFYAPGDGRVIFVKLV